MDNNSRQLFLRKMRVALTPRSTLLRTRLQNGATVEGYNRAGYGGRGVYLFRDALEPELCHLHRFLAPGKVFLDIGANVGVFTVKAAKEVGKTGLVIAVEPFIETAFRLSANVLANGYGNVRVRNFCIGQHTQHARLHLNHGKPNSFSLVSKGQADSVSVLCVSLDDLCRWEQLDRLDYLKIDAEGAEAAILAGGQETIARFRPIVQMEQTICKADLDMNYRRFAAPRSANTVFIPAENTAAIATSIALGWADHKDIQ